MMNWRSMHSASCLISHLFIHNVYIICDFEHQGYIQVTSLTLYLPQKSAHLISCPPTKNVSLLYTSDYGKMYIRLIITKNYLDHNHLEKLILFILSTISYLAK